MVAEGATNIYLLLSGDILGGATIDLGAPKTSGLDHDS
jgi:hypothetical protein